MRSTTAELVAAALANLERQMADASSLLRTQV
jgi:hypothetical protein